MKTLGQLKSVYKSSLETSEAIKQAIKDYGDTMNAMMIIGRPEYDRSGRVSIETRLKGMEAVEIYPGSKVGHNVFLNVVVVNQLGV